MYKSLSIMITFVSFSISDSSKASANIDQNLDLVLLVVNQGAESLSLNLVELDLLGDHTGGLDLALGNGLDHSLEVAQAEGGGAHVVALTVD